MSVYRLLDSVSATGAGTVYHLSPTEWSGVYTVHLVVEDDTNLSDWVCTIEGGLTSDTTTFCVLDQVDFTNDNNSGDTASMMHFEKEPVEYIRANLTTITGVGVVSVYLLVQPIL